MTCVCNIICSHARSHIIRSLPFSRLPILSLSDFISFPSLSLFVLLYRSSTWFIHFSSPLITLMELHFSPAPFRKPSFSLHLSHPLSLSLWGEKHCFPLTKTLLLSGNYRRRLITTLGSNDAAPNEIFIKDPSASN